ncbi:tetratricopeptide repeat protein [Sulfuricurvum sp. IAE1]|uniref:tetratricopeptide repeat protein n=1 Tax=Sulfuricurvum sp. IAE1 TaxID=2546102 RepID=UPI00105401B1|nr:tetratricopeptide repeat protein [Sulfuricurvum sp. IAE1]TDA69054.1 tetratricopeptide repeat protein [Sulfuricurvum sp. IAE1]
MKHPIFFLLYAGIISTASFANSPCDGAYLAKNYDQATQCFGQQLKKDRSFYNLKGVGFSFVQQGRYKEALPFLKEAEKKARTSFDYSIIYSWLGTCYGAMGDSEQTFVYRMKSLDLMLKSGNRDEIGRAYSNLGVYFFDHGQPKKAIEYYEKALDYRDENEHSNIYANIALAYQELNDTYKTEEMYQKSIEIAEKTGNLNGLATFQKNLGAFYFTQNRYGDARKTLEKALILARQVRAIDDESHALSILAVIDYEEGHLNEAKVKASEGLRLAKQSGDRKVFNDAQAAWDIVNGK